MSMIERVARAMYEDDNGQLWETSSFRNEYLRNAKVAIKAMRDPSDAMLLAAECTHSSIDRVDATLDTRVGRGSRTLEVHIAMIDAAIDPGQYGKALADLIGEGYKDD